MTEQNVYVFSNASTISHPDNTLTRFVNELPETLHIPKNENWYICAESVGFSTNFSTIMPPDDETLPNIKIYSFNNDIVDFVFNSEILGDDQGSMQEIKHEVFDGTIQGAILGPDQDAANYHFYDYNTSQNIFKEMFLEAEIFFPSGKITVDDIRHTLKIIDGKNIKISYEAVMNQQMVFRIREDTEKFYCMLFHKNTIKTFGLSTTKICGVTHINGEKYYMIRLDDQNTEVCGDLNRWHKKFPELIKIRCDEIEEQIFNNKLTKDLVSFCPTINDGMSYIYYEFQTREYVKISNTILSKLSISFIDEYNLQIPLSKGVASFVKLNIKKMPLDYDRFNIRISSSVKTNDDTECSSIFTVDLPYPYYLDPSWNVSLTSINFPASFRPLPSEKKSRRILTSKIHDNSINHFYIPNKHYNKSGLISIINAGLKHTGSSITLFSTSLALFDNKKVNQYCHILLKKGSFINIPIPIMELLGCDIGKESASPHILIENGSIVFANPTEEDVFLQMSNTMEMDILKPHYMMIYTDMIKPIIVGNTYSKLLRVVPIQHSENYDYKVQDFRHRENHPLENTLLKTIHIEIRSHTGELINFAEGKQVHLNLLFSRDA